MTLIPPDELIIKNGIGIGDWQRIEEKFRTIGEGIARSLQRQAGMMPESHVLDIGCGLGRVARPLTTFLTTGSYTGVDVLRSSIDWCSQNYSAFPNFKFHHLDVFSTRYNRDGAHKAEEYRFTFPDASFDLIWSTSLFTHLEIAAVGNYLKEIARMLKPGRNTWNTYFLLDEVSDPVAAKPGARPWLPYEVDGGRVAKNDNPEEVTGLSFDRIRALHERFGLTITRTIWGGWSGREGTRGGSQDVLLARKG